jgi:hypothetical protein
MIFDVQEMVAPADFGVVLAAFKAFALAHGWTLDGDSSGVFQLSSPGFGNQKMIYRFQGQYTGSYAVYGVLTMIGVNPGTPAFSTSMTTGAFSSTGAYNQVSLRGSGAYKAWILGNDKALVLVQQNNEYSCSNLVVGSFDLFDTTRDDGYFLTHSRGYSSLYPWDSLTSTQYNTYLFPGTTFYGVGVTHTWFYGAGRNDSAVRSNFYMYNVNTPGGAFDHMGDFISGGLMTPYAGGRFVVRPTAYGLDSSASVWRPIGQWPWYLLKFTGLVPGQVLDFGGENYMVFPSMYMPHPYGWAVRVA